MTSPESTRRPRRAKGILAHWATIVRSAPSDYEKEVLRRTVSSSRAVAQLLGPRLAAEMGEVFCVVCLDGRNHVLAMTEIARGGTHAITVDARFVFRVAIAYNATSLVLVHNHPSGDPTPSDEDIKLTARLCEIADVVGISIVDHVILAGERHASLLDLGLLKAA
jgi:DNA repair protein RadC